MQVTVRIEDYSDAVKEAVNEMVNDLCVAAAESLAKNYREILSENTAPPHSAPGEIPHSYNGWKPGGYGPVNTGTEINNIPPFFSSMQSAPLHKFISSDGGGIGFTDSHVTDRSQNYLLFYSITKDASARREWVSRGYKEYKTRLRSRLQARVRANRASRGDSGVPF